MFKPVKAKTIEEYLASLPHERRKAIKFLHQFIQRATPGLKPHFSYNMIGYGNFLYKNYKGEEIQWPIVSLANQKNYISMYICAVVNDEYIAEKNKSRLGRVNVGKSCIRFDDVNKVNLTVLEELIKMAAKNPGFSTR